MFFQLATGYAGVWYGIDPFDQPGVELGKRLTYAAMGRPGYRRADGRSRGRASRRSGTQVVQRLAAADRLTLSRSRPTFTDVLDTADTTRMTMHG